MSADTLATWLPIGIVGFVFLSLWFYHWKRKKAYREFAEGRGMVFGESGLPQGVPANVRRLPFIAARGGSMGYSASGTFEGRRCAVFDFTYKSGKNSHTITMAWADPGRELPPLELREENFLDRMAAVVGWEDVDFDDDPDFSAAWHLKSANVEAARGALGPMTRRRLLAETGWRIEAEGRSVVVYKSAGRRADAAVMEEYLRAAGRIASALANR